MMTLRDVQQWMQAVITHPDGVHAGAISTAACEAIGTTLHESQLDELILPSRHLTSEQRIGIYASAYYARLLECMHEEFPAVAKLLGEEIFDGLVVEYVQSYPSSSYTLGELGSRFHQFLSENRERAYDGEVNVANDDGSDWIDLMLDLAITERTYSEVFVGPGIEDSETLSTDALSRVDSESIGSIRLLPAPCVRLLSLATQAHGYAIAVRKGRESTPELPSFTTTFLVVTRRNYIVQTLVVGRVEYLLLQQLFSGATLEQAISNICELGSVDEEKLEQQIGIWFQKWAADRLFISFQVEL